MRWKALFDDLEAQLEAADLAELAGEVRDRTRREAGLITASDRFRGSVGNELTVSVQGAGVLTARLGDVGPDWLLLEASPTGDVLVPTAALLAVSGLSRRAQPPAGRVAERLDLRWALRGLTRDRAPLQVVLRDGTLVSGTIDRVGADHVELAEHAQGELRRANSVSGLRLLPLSGLALLRPA